MLRHDRNRLCDDPYTGKRRTSDFQSECGLENREVVPKSVASDYRPVNLVCVASIPMPRCARIGASNKVLVGACSAKRSDVPGVVDNKTRVRSWGLAHGRSPLMATMAAKLGRLAEVWWGRRVKTEVATSSWDEVALSRRAPGKHEGQQDAPRQSYWQAGMFQRSRSAEWGT